MKDEARLDLAPHDVRSAPLPWKQTDPRAVRSVPAKWKAVAGEYGPHRECDGEVEYDHEAGRESAVVDTRTVFHWDRHVADHPAGCRDDDMTDGVPDTSVIGDRVRLSGDRVAVRMPGERSGERPVERIVALRLQGLG